MKILIVDDSKAMRLLITRALKELGLGASVFLEAPDGNQALKKVEEAQPDLIFCDFNMPGMSGMEVLQTLRAREIGTRFGFVTSEASDELRRESEKHGAQFVITKPFTAAHINLALMPVLVDLGCRTMAPEDAALAGYSKAADGFPKALDVAGFLKGLLPKPVIASPIRAAAVSLAGGEVIAEFEQASDGSLIACAVCDLACAVRLGAALTLIPAGAVADAMKASLVDPGIVENLREVMNVMSRLFEGENSARVRLGAVYWPGETVPAMLAARIAKASHRVAVGLEIAGYGKGSLTLLSVR